MQKQSTVKYRQLFLRKASSQMFHWVLSTSPVIVSKYVCFFYHFFHFESIKFRSSRSQMSFKIDVIKNLPIFTEIHLYRSLFVIKFPACKPANLLKRDSHTSVFLLILLIFRSSFFIEHLRQLLLKAMFETNQSFTMKNKIGFS